MITAAAIVSIHNYWAAAITIDRLNVYNKRRSKPWKYNAIGQYHRPMKNPC